MIIGDDDMKHIYTSIDIGTDAIKVVVCELYQNKLNLLAASCIPSKGIKKGLITDVEAAQMALRKAVGEVEEMLGIKIRQVLASVPSYYADFKLVSSAIAIEPTIDDEPAEIEGKDISILLKKASYQKRNPNDELVTTVPIDFKIDHRLVVKSPLGLPASTLEVRAIAVTTPKKNIYSVLSLIEGIGLQVKDITLNGIGDMYAFKNKDMDSKVGAIINIGAETTSISLYNKGIIVKNSVIGLGGKNIDNDLSYIYKLNGTIAKTVKENFALAHKRFANASDVYEVANHAGESIKIKQLEASEVVMARLEEILGQARQEIHALTNHEIDYILVTGGASNMTNFDVLVKTILGKKAMVGNMKLIGVRNNRYSSSVGNIVYYISKLKLLGIRDTMVSEDDCLELSSGRNLVNVNNESMLGKVFGYFFNE